LKIRFKSTLPKPKLLIQSYRHRRKAQEAFILCGWKTLDHFDELHEPDSCQNSLNSPVKL